MFKSFMIVVGRDFFCNKKTKKHYPPNMPARSRSKQVKKSKPRRSKQPKARPASRKRSSRNHHYFKNNASPQPNNGKSIMYGILNLSDKKFSTEQEANEVLTFGDSLRNALNSLRPYDKESELVDLKQSYKKLDRLYTNAQPKMKQASAYLQSNEQEAQKAQSELERKTIEAQKDVTFYFILAGRD